MSNIIITPVNINFEINKGDNLAQILVDSKQEIKNGMVLVISQKIVSKSEGRVVNLDDVKPSILAKGIASEYNKDARIVELVISNAKRIVRMKDGIIITQTHSGFVCANSGVDESNVAKGYAVLLPKEPDSSARQIRSQISSMCGANIGVIISDTFGRAFRIGQTDCAIGSAGLEPVSDYAGKADKFSKVMRTTMIATADELAGAAELVMGKTEQCPMVLISGKNFNILNNAKGALSLIRPESDDLFI